MILTLPFRSHETQREPEKHTAERPLLLFVTVRPNIYSEFEGERARNFIWSRSPYFTTSALSHSELRKTLFFFKFFQAIVRFDNTTAAPRGAGMRANAAPRRGVCDVGVGVGPGGVGEGWGEWERVLSRVKDGARTLASVFVCACVQTPLVLVPLHVQGEVVGSGERARTHGTLEGLGAGVFPVVARQLVGPREAPVAAVPGAAVRLLTGVSPEVGLQMGRLGVDLLAAWVITVVDSPFLQVRIVPPVVANRQGVRRRGRGPGRRRRLGKDRRLARNCRRACGYGHG